MTIHLIKAGFANTYLIGDQKGFAAIDVGSDRAAEKIVCHIVETLNRPLHHLKLILSTHFHIDHISGIPKLLSLCPNTPVLFSFSAQAYLSGMKKPDIFPFSKWIKGLLPILFRLDHQSKNTRRLMIGNKAGIPLPFLRRLNQITYKHRCILKHQTALPGFQQWHVIETPGHTPDSICYYHLNKKMLISGDTILNMRGTGELNPFHLDKRKIRQSFKALSAYPVHHLYPGHGTPIVNNDSIIKQIKTSNEK